MAPDKPALSELALRQLRAHRASMTKRTPGFTQTGMVRRNASLPPPKITLRRADYEREKGKS